MNNKSGNHGHFHGLLNIDKPFGATSRDVVDALCRILETKRVGHAGTLDPQATGVLVVLVGNATRLNDYVQKGFKQYEAQFRFGLTSTTDDIWGNVQTHQCSEPEMHELERAVKQLTGHIAQVPPRVSAVKIQGKRAYQLARQGIDFQTQPRVVHVRSFVLHHLAFPNVHASIECGSGTYIRSLARDLGHEVGCPAVLSSLCRTRVGPFKIEDAVRMNQISRENVGDFLLPMSLATSEIAQVVLSELEVEEIKFGRLIELGRCNEMAGEIAALDEHGTLMAVLSRHDSGRFKPRINLLAAK
ncbi:MAG TPA: tRNA pseudouridine(55) synthase TruB [Pirellulaceae bacterium]|nr:tRNA pseudouridine(55) synthase TruB [Pirellulaceae bacterium]HMO93644.1 tRNA pseudouridine(55) synthase TruB [Pirellulaceae bacterium]HMP70648.1 tRNA pseudouridine(55) synthase TruB [Pirellulaceae bacterium]